MEMNDYEDRIVHTLLREQVGGETPPDLTAKIFSRAYPRRRVRPVFWAIPLAEVSTFVFVLLANWLFVYPQPEAKGAYVLSGGERLDRGARIVSQARPVELTLGGYCQVTMAENSAVRLWGTRRQEAIILDQGQATCEVARNVGTFNVYTQAGRVEVKGTKFVVRLAESEGDETLLGKRMVVHVVSGSVIASTPWAQYALASGEDKTLPEGGTVVGVVIEKGATWIRVKADDGESVKYLPRWIGGAPKDGGGFDKDMLRQIASLSVGSKVKIVWKQEEHRRLLKLTVLDAPAGAK